MANLDGVRGFLGEKQIASLQGLIDRGYKTAKEFMDPTPMVEILRQPPGGGPPVSQGSFQAIMIRFGQRGANEPDETGPVTVGLTSGIMHHEYDVFDLKTDDIVLYEGRSSRVIATYPNAFGVVISELELMQ